MGQKIKKNIAGSIPFGRRNYVLFGLSALVLLIGYWALSQGPVDGFLTLTLAPILLGIGYCILIPVAILSNGKKEGTDKRNPSAV
jgi:hypothetical protein